MKHYFFYFFESREDPFTDDVLLWTNGGESGYVAVYQDVRLTIGKDQVHPRPWGFSSSWASNPATSFLPAFDCDRQVLAELKPLTALPIILTRGIAKRISSSSINRLV